MYQSSPDGVDTSLLILLHGLGDKYVPAPCVCTALPAR